MHNEEQFAQLIEQNRQLLARIARLEKRIDTLSGSMARHVKTAREYDAALARQGDMAQAEIRDAFERIINLELKIFPNLAGDIDRLQGIIGGGDTNYRVQNQLDQKKP